MMREVLGERAGFSILTRRSWVLIPARSFFFILFCSFFNTRRVFGFKYCPSPRLTFFFKFLNIEQYLFVHCKIPSILGSHPPYPISPPNPNIVFTSTMSPGNPTPTLPPTPPPPRIFFIEFSQKHQFFVHIHPDPPNPTPNPTPDPTPPIFFRIFTKLHFYVHIYLIPQPDPPP